jgi:two-component system cell cycle response regulator DivK
MNWCVLFWWLAAEKLKSDEVTKSIPLYALTAHTLPSERKRAIEAGCDGYVSKPIHMNGFLNMIEAALGKGNEKKIRKTREVR